MPSDALGKEVSSLLDCGWDGGETPDDRRTGSYRGCPTVNNRGEK